MSSYEHKKLLERMGKLDEVPSEPEDFSEWIKGEAHLEFLRQNALTDELVVCASGEYSFVHAVAVPNDRLWPVDQDDLMGWNFYPYSSIASYVTGGGRGDVWIERGLSRTGTEALEDAVQLIFGRTFEGWTGAGSSYYELHQEYAHLTDIHWRREKRAYCRFNEHGELEHVVSISTREEKESSKNLVSFKREPLEEYLVASNASLVRMFDFTLSRRSGSGGWPNEPPQKFYDADHFFYHRQVMPGYAAYTRGVQIIRPRPQRAIFTGITEGWSGQQKSEHAEFIAFDWRNGRIAKISTDPSATANYFNAKGNSLPFELSPAFFRPDVLLKYKMDRDKYTVGERDVSCRAAWHLKGIDVNEAGQIHAYICDLRRLPYEEQLYWSTFNEAPKASISERACAHDFQGKFVSFMGPLQRVLAICRRWHDDRVAWWRLRDEKLLERVNTPLTSSREEWAEAYMDLAKLVVEGFETKPIRAELDKAEVPYEKKDGTIALLEKLLNTGDKSGDLQKLEGLREVQLLRSKVKAHVGGSVAQRLAEEALMEHESFGNHFRHLCTKVVDELETIEKQIAENQSI